MNAKFFQIINYFIILLKHLTILCNRSFTSETHSDGENKSFFQHFLINMKLTRIMWRNECFSSLLKCIHRFKVSVRKENISRTWLLFIAIESINIFDTYSKVSERKITQISAIKSCWKDLLQLQNIFLITPLSFFTSPLFKITPECILYFMLKVYKCIMKWKCFHIFFIIILG